MDRTLFDACFDAVTDELERVNNEVYRLLEDETDGMDPEAT